MRDSFPEVALVPDITDPLTEAGVGKFDGSECDTFNHIRRIEVSNTLDLINATDNAVPGDLIYVLPGLYGVKVMGKRRYRMSILNKNATEEDPITVCGPSTAIINQGDFNGPTIVQITNSSYINIVGMTLKMAQKAIEVDNGFRIRLHRITIKMLGREAIHFRRGSTQNVVSHCTITNTGNVNKGNGEGVYIGTDDDDFIDPCSRNHVLYNHIGPGVKSEGIDLKQYTSEGLILKNVLNGNALSGEHFATATISVKGNGYKVLQNIGLATREDMFKVVKHVGNTTQGTGNFLAGNKCPNGVPSGFVCVRIPDFGGGDKSPNKVGCGQGSNSLGCIARRR